jgi:hypothetical protein
MVQQQTKIGETVAWDGFIIGFNRAIKWRDGVYDIFRIYDSSAPSQKPVGYTVIHQDEQLTPDQFNEEFGKVSTDIGQINFAGMTIQTGGDGGWPMWGAYETVEDYYARTQNKPKPIEEESLGSAMEYHDRQAIWKEDFVTWCRSYTESDESLQEWVVRDIAHRKHKVLIGARLGLHNPSAPTLIVENAKGTFWVIEIPSLIQQITDEYGRQKQRVEKKYVNTATTVKQYFDNLKSLYPDGRLTESAGDKTRLGFYQTQYATPPTKTFTITLPAFGEYQWIAKEYPLGYASPSREEQRRKEKQDSDNREKAWLRKKEKERRERRAKYGAESFGAENDNCPTCRDVTKEYTEYQKCGDCGIAVCGPDGCGFIAQDSSWNNNWDWLCKSCYDEDIELGVRSERHKYSIYDAESFGAEMDGKKLIASSYDLADGSMMVGVGTETLDVDDPDFMEMMIDEDGKIDYFTLPIGLDKWERSYRIKPTHYGKMKTQNETNEAVGGDFIRTDGEGKYAESFEANECSHIFGESAYQDATCSSCGKENDVYVEDDSDTTICSCGNRMNGYTGIGIDSNHPMRGKSVCERCGVYGAESFGAETPCSVMVWKDGALTECGWWNEKNEPCVYHPDGKEINAESFASYDMPISERQRYRIRKLGGRIDKAMNRSDASRYIKSLMAVPLHAETADCPTCQGWGWNEELDIVCDADGCIGGWFIPKKPSLFKRGLESGLGIGAGIAGVALVMGLLGGSAGFAYEEMTKRRD